MKPSMLHQMQGRIILCQWATHLPESIKSQHVPYSGSLSPMSRSDAHTSVELWLRGRKATKDEAQYLRGHYRCYGSGDASLIEPPIFEMENLKKLRLDAEAWAAEQSLILDPLTGLSA